jgi:hypothetical protein
MHYSSKGTEGRPSVKYAIYLINTMNVLTDYCDKQSFESLIDGNKFSDDMNKWHPRGNIVPSMATVRNVGT